MSRTRSGAWLVRYALEQLPVSLTFGIPGVHNTEIYDELSRSERIRPILVTHEAGAAFMADAVSRTSGGRIGVLVIVPAAGLTHAMSGIGEAFLAGLTKKSWKVTEHRDIVPTIFEAYRTAVSGCPGPVFVEVPVNVQLFQGKKIGRA